MNSIFRTSLCFATLLINVGCRPQQAAVSQQASSGGGSSLPKATFAPIPGNCEGERSQKKYCDGYWMRNSTEGALPVYAENRSSNWPTEEGLFLISGPFDPNKPTVIFMHGWMGEVPQHTKVGFPDMWRDQARAAGFNVMLFQWFEMAWDSGDGCPGLRPFDVNSPCHASKAIFARGGAADVFIKAYRNSKYFPETYKREIRFVGHSLGTELAITTAYRLHTNTSLNNLAMPSRVDLIDPALATGMGGSRTEPYDGQIPPDDKLPGDYTVVKDFVPGSVCRSNGGFGQVLNAMSQYCQLEGIAYHLVRDHNVAMIDFSSITGGATASDFAKTMVYQAFDGGAFKGHRASRHGTPLVAYWFSYAPGEPPGGYDASSPSELILRAAKEQIRGVDVSLIQTSGQGTITMNDDGYKPRSGGGVAPSKL